MAEHSISALVKTAYHALDEKKARNISVIDISGISVIADYFVIATAENARQTQALCDNVEEQLGKAGYACSQIEGKAGTNWILMDYQDVIVHIFDEESRRFYDLERIWRDGKQITDVEALA